MATTKKTSVQRKEDESLCPVCHERMEIFAVGRCDHTICFRCAVRMRVLCDQMYCAICRADLLQVLFLHRRQRFETVDTSNFCVNRQYKIFCEDADIDLQYRRLLEHSCKLCLSIEPFRSFQHLREHMQREHTLFYCDLCVNNLKLFTVHRKHYTRVQLGHHRRVGDDDDRSYKGHPLCQFCDERYFDNDDLLRHLRKQHFYCHFCESDGITNEYFSDYALLREHFKTAHVVCEEGECRDAEFTNVFRSSIDYRAHWAQKHSAGVGRQQARQMRQIDISVDFGSHNDAATAGDGRGHRGSRQRGSGRRGDTRDSGGMNSRAADTDGRQTVRERREVERKRREELDQAHALSASLADVQRQGHISVINRQLAQHPMMMSASAAPSTDTSVPSTKYQGHLEDFPTLGGMQQSSRPTVEESQEAKSSIVENPDSESGPRVGISLAKKLAMSNRLTVRNGPMDLADFPSLSTVRPTKTRKGPPVSKDDFPSLSSSTNAKLSKTSKASVWNTTDKASTDQIRPSSHAEKSDNFPSKNGDNDFPSLSSVAPATDKNSSQSAASLPCSSLASISRNFSSGSLSKITDKSGTTSNPPSLSWGPELSRKLDNPKEKEREVHDNFLHLKANKKSAVREAWGSTDIKHTPSEVSYHVKPAATTSHVSNKSAISSATVLAAPSETTPYESDKHMGDSSVADSSGWMVAGGEKKIQSKPSKNNTAKPPSDKASFKQGESKKVTKSKTKLEDSSSQSKNGKDKSKKNQKTGKAQREKTGEETSLKDGTKQLSEPIVVDSKSGAKTGDNDIPSKHELCEASEMLLAGSNGDSVTSRKEHDVGDSGHGCAALSGEGIESTPVVDNSQTVDVAQSADTNDAATAMPLFNADDFPSLSIQELAPSSLPSLPPGFSSLPVSSSKPPPPGFSNPVVSHCPLPGLNFSLSSAVVSDADNVHKASEVVDSDVSISTYIPPRDMQQRSASLVGLIKSAVRDGNFGEFSELCAKFRAGNITADEYHSGCCDILDPTAFQSIFPELIALLPDLPKQNELLKVHWDFLSKTQQTEKARSWRAATEDDLVLCRVCGQVLRHSDLHDHASEHDTFNAEYPTLPNTSLCSVR